MRDKPRCHAEKPLGARADCLGGLCLWCKIRQCRRRTETGSRRSRSVPKRQGAAGAQLQRRAPEKDAKRIQSFVYSDGIIHFLVRERKRRQVAPPTGAPAKLFRPSLLQGRQRPPSAGLRSGRNAGQAGPFVAYRRSGQNTIANTVLSLSPDTKSCEIPQGLQAG